MTQSWRLKSNDDEGSLTGTLTTPWEMLKSFEITAKIKNKVRQDNGLQFFI